MSDEPETVDHGPTECAFDNIRRSRVIFCACGHACYGDTWEEAGAEMDDHLDDVEGVDE